MGREDKELTADERLRSIVNYAADHVPFYRRKFEESQVRLESFSGRPDLPTLPILTPQELVMNAQELVSEVAKPYRISSSSGTLRNPKTLFRTPLDTSTSALVMKRLFRMAQISAMDRLLIGQPFDLAHLGYLCLDACREMGVLAIPAGLSVSNERMVQMIQLHQPTAIYTSPSRMTAVISLLEESSIKRSDCSVNKVLFSGERAADAHINLVQDYWGVTPHDLYGSEETDGLAGSCEENHGLHFMDDLFVLELVNPGSDDLIADGEDVGEAVITSLYMEGTPLIRYRLGDLIRRSHEACPCGRPWPVISVLGRADEVLFLFDGIKLYAKQVESVLKEKVAAHEAFQLVCRTVREGLEEVEVILDVPADSRTGVDIGRLEQDLWEASLDLGAARKMGSLQFRITFGREKMNTSQRGKTPRVWDARLNRERGLPQ